jgi:tRNA (cytidine56-2'-O)-methyltransferase
MRDIWVLRLGHRPDRDKRITTHVALTARAFGAKGILVSTKDTGLERSVNGVVQRFGGEFTIRTGVQWRCELHDFQGFKAHLTMYGVPVDQAKGRVPVDRDLMIIVGAEKVPPEVYQEADLNIAVGNQPHSEVAALAILLDRLAGGNEFQTEFGGGSMKVLPCERGKNVVTVPKP